MSAKQKRKDMMKRSEEDTAAGYKDPFQPNQPAVVGHSNPAAKGGPQPVSTEAEFLTPVRVVASSHSAS